MFENNIYVYIDGSTSVMSLTLDLLTISPATWRSWVTLVKPVPNSWWSTSVWSPRNTGSSTWHCVGCCRGSPTWSPGRLRSCVCWRRRPWAPTSHRDTLSRHSQVRYCIIIWYTSGNFWLLTVSQKLDLIICDNYYSVLTLNQVIIY